MIKGGVPAPYVSRGALAFESNIAPTTVFGIPNTSGGATQTIVVDRTQFTQPVKTGSIIVKKGAEMSIRKLVQLDDETWRWTEIDVVKLKRVATKFRAWLISVDPGDDPFGFLKHDLLLVDAALSGSMPLPYKGWEPHMRELGEGLLPRDYARVSAPFYNTVRGAHLTPPQIVERDGKRYAWAEFEDPPAHEGGVDPPA